MSELVFPSLEEAGQDPVLSEGEVLPVRWSAEVLCELDWKRLVEIARAMAVFGGFEPGVTRVEQDGSAEFEMVQGKGRDARRVRVRLAPWNRWMVTGSCLESFAQRLSVEGRMRGVYLAPGGIAPSAVVAAQKAGIELVDAGSLALKLNQLPQEHSQFFFDIATSGSSGVPTCPVCMKRLSRWEDALPDQPDYVALPDLTYQTNDIVADSVTARRVEVLRNCEVHFLREVHAQDVVVHGVAVGDFVCDGCLLLNPGAVLCGVVAARSVLVRPGAELRGETRILQGALEPRDQGMRQWTWRCLNVPHHADCGGISFLPH